MALSPMMQHYLQIKENYKDCIVFYRLGDFYEMFFEDAIKVSSLLELTLTGRDCGLEERAPMCGIPFHAADTYISKLVSLGERVAICEQLTSPKAKELVKRDVIKIVTAGTITNDELIDEKSNNFIASVYVQDKNVAISWADITTGEFYTKSFTENNTFSLALDTLVKISPAEIISNAKACEIFNEIPLVKHGVIPTFKSYLESEYNFNNAENSLKNQFGVLSLSSYGFTDDYSISVAGSLLAFLRDTQKQLLKNISTIKIEKNGEFMLLDVNATRNLELTKTLRDGKRHGSLLWLLDKTKTNMGARKLQSWILSPLGDKNKINYRLNAINAFYTNTPVRQSLSDILTSVKDVGRITGKIANGNLYPKDCLALKNSLKNIPAIKFQLLGLNSEFIQDISNRLLELTEVSSLLEASIAEDLPNNIKDGGYIKEGFNEELDRLRSLNKNSLTLIAQMEAREREKTGIRNLKIAYNRVFGYYIEVTNSFKELVPYEYKRRQTLAGSERFITEELSSLETDILTSEEKSITLENNLYNDIKEFLISKIDELKTVSDALSDLDVVLSFSTVAKENDYIMPTMLDADKHLNIVDGRHPVVEKISKQKFIPNDVLLDNDENRTAILTGPNMAGKSTYMRQTALIVLMAHIGSFVPAKSAEIPLIDKIFTRVGASDNLISDQSTFMVEMTEVADIINNATKNSLIILDEIGRGTSTFDGLSIAWAVVEYVTKKIKAKTMFATHYHELTELEGKLDGVKNYKVTVKELPSGIVFLRKILRGGANKSFGIEVAELAGVDRILTERAREILKKLESKDIVRKSDNNLTNEHQQSEVERIIKDIDVNNISPMQAMEILLDLQEKIKG